MVHWQYNDLVTFKYLEIVVKFKKSKIYNFFPKIVVFPYETQIVWYILVYCYRNTSRSIFTPENIWWINKNTLYFSKFNFKIRNYFRKRPVDQKSVMRDPFLLKKIFLCLSELQMTQPVLNQLKFKHQ